MAQSWNLSPSSMLWPVPLPCRRGRRPIEREVLPESRIVFRMGINVGDVVVEDGDLLGDGVNIAARLEALADPGGICICRSVQKQLAGKTDLAFEDTGERTLKNIAQPVRVWRWGGERPLLPQVRRRLCPTGRPSLSSRSTT